MAILTLTLDTEDQTMSVEVDGNAVANINEVAVSNWGSGDDPRFSFYVTSFEKVGGVHKMTRLMANKSPEAKQAAEDGLTVTPSKALAGFVESPVKDKVTQQVEAWFKSTRRQ